MTTRKTRKVDYSKLNETGFDDSSTIQEIDMATAEREKGQQSQAADDSGLPNTNEELIPEASNGGRDILSLAMDDEQREENLFEQDPERDLRNLQQMVDENANRRQQQQRLENNGTNNEKEDANQEDVLQIHAEDDLGDNGGKRMNLLNEHIKKGDKSTDTARKSRTPRRSPVIDMLKQTLLTPSISNNLDSTKNKRKRIKAASAAAILDYSHIIADNNEEQRGTEAGKNEAKKKKEQKKRYVNANTPTKGGRGDKAMNTNTIGTQQTNSEQWTQYHDLALPLPFSGAPDAHVINTRMLSSNDPVKAFTHSNRIIEDRPAEQIFRNRFKIAQDAIKQFSPVQKRKQSNKRTATVTSTQTTHGQTADTQPPGNISPVRNNIAADLTDIDYIPTKGQNNSFVILDKAKKLVANTKVDICRQTGIRRKVKSTATAADNPQMRGRSQQEAEGGAAASPQRNRTRQTGMQRVSTLQHDHDVHNHARRERERYWQPHMADTHVPNNIPNICTPPHLQQMANVHDNQMLRPPSTQERIYRQTIPTVIDYGDHADYNTINMASTQRRETGDIRAQETNIPNTQQNILPNNIEQGMGAVNPGHYIPTVSPVRAQNHVDTHPIIAQHVPMNEQLPLPPQPQRYFRQNRRRENVNPDDYYYHEYHSPRRETNEDYDLSYDYRSPRRREYSPRRREGRRRGDYSPRRERRRRSAERSYDRDRYYEDRSRRRHRSRRDDEEPRHRRIQGQSYDSTSSSKDRRLRPRKIKSGISAKPTSSVKFQLVYPHFSLGQTSGFIGTNIQFHQLTYEQFMAGELTTIKNTEDVGEHDGRIELLTHISQWSLRANVTWPQIRNVYAHIIRKLENHEISWRTDWSKFERHIYDKVASKQDRKPTSSNTPTSTVGGQNKMTWFCRNYQKTEGCNKNAPHAGRVGNKFRSLEHICAACWLKDKVKRPHPEYSTDCPNKQQ